MNRTISLVVLVGGISLTLLGVQAARSMGSGLSNFFTGFPTEKSMWMIAGGVVISLIGLAGLGTCSRIRSCKQAP